MRRLVATIIFVLAFMPAFGQDDSINTQAQTSLPPLTAPQAQAPVHNKQDALLLYNQGRNLDTAGKAKEAADKYRQAITICEAELATDPSRMDAHTVRCWSLFRLGQYKDVISKGETALKIKFDARIVEVMGEAYYHVGDMQNALKHLQRYLVNAGEYADRVATAYFYMAESYMRLKRYDHADISYALAVTREPSMARWWYRYGGSAEALGEYARARDLYTKALALSPNMSDVQSALDRVKTRL